MDALYRDFGRQLRARRRQAHLTQEQLADRVGLSRTSITNIEKGTQHTALHVLYQLAGALGVTPADLLPVQRRSAEVVLPAEVQQAVRQALSERDQEWVTRVVRSAALEEDVDDEANG